ncbi:hypothetical protein ACQKDS_07175 [Serratia sp. NPDC078593]|uniref:hypothetical protein n=1 Tax=unclassified Serratia (in: enterobacteria) TaxID=2647522 RepID=UPI0037CD36C9
MVKGQCGLIALLLLPWLATAANGINTLSEPQPLPGQDYQQQRMLNNQHRDQRRMQQQRQFENNRQKLRQTAPKNRQILPNGNQPQNPFDRTTPAVEPIKP